MVRLYQIQCSGKVAMHYVDSSISMRFQCPSDFDQHGTAMLALSLLYLYESIFGKVHQVVSCMRHTLIMFPRCILCRRCYNGPTALGFSRCSSSEEKSASSVEVDYTVPSGFDILLVRVVQAHRSIDADAVDQDVDLAEGLACCISQNTWPVFG